MLDGVEGRDSVGTFLCLSALERYWWGEGEVKFYLDGDKTIPPSAAPAPRIILAARGLCLLSGGKCVETTYQTPSLATPYYSVKDGTVETPYHDDSCPPMRSFLPIPHYGSHPVFTKP